MASIALRTGATGIEAQSQKINVIANNIANANTVGFKSSRANFEDLLYQTLAQPGAQTGNGEQRAVGLQIGLGVGVSSTSKDFSTGSPLNTNNPLDLMIEGPGFFRVSTPEALGGGVAYTRAGNFSLNADGELVLQNSDGFRLDPPLEVPENASGVTITRDGRVFASLPGQTDQQELAQIQLFGFINPNGLKAEGNNLYTATDASGEEIQGVPDDEQGLGSVLQGFVESSNVSPTRELIDLIEAQRTFEMNSQVVQAADNGLQVIANLGR